MTRAPAGWAALRIGGGAAAVLGIASALAILTPGGSGQQRGPAASAPDYGAAARAALVRTPLAFEKNAGQAAEARFVARGPGYRVQLRDDGAVLQVGGRRPAAITTRLLGSGRVTLRAERRLPGNVNYLVGPRRDWRRSVPTYGRVFARGVYPGVDLVYHGRGGALEYDFLVERGADPGRITLALDGAQKLRIDTHGDLILSTGSSQLVQRRPRAWQTVAGERRPVAVRYAMDGNHVGFKLGAYDDKRPLVIDPVLAYGSYLGGDDEDTPWAVDSDAQGNIYIAGETFSSDFPAPTGSLHTSPGGMQDGFVAKLAPSGGLIYSTYFGGSADDAVYALAVDSDGRAHLGGGTESDGLATTGALDTTRSGLDGFVATLSADGSALQSLTYLGGGGDERIGQLVLDADGNVYVSGGTDSTDFPVSNTAYQGTKKVDGTKDIFIAKLDGAGTQRLWATYYGGNALDLVDGMDVDPDGNVYVAGKTTSTDLIGFGGTMPKGGTEGYAARINAGGGSLAWSYYLSGTGEDSVNDLAYSNVAPYPMIVVVGTTTSSGAGALPASGVTAGGSATYLGGPNDMFLTELYPLGGIARQMYFGTSASDTGDAVDTDAQGNFYIAGTTTSNAFPRLHEIQSFGGATDAVLFKLTPPSPDGQVQVYSTYFGGTAIETVQELDVDSNGRALLTGGAFGAGTPTLNAVQDDFAGASDAYVAALAIPTIAGFTQTPTAVTDSKSATFTWDTPETNLSFKCSLDQAAFTSCATPRQLTNLSDGAHTFRVKPFDEGGTTNGQVLTHVWTVDTLPPAAFDLEGPADGATVDTFRPTLSWHAATDSGAGVASYSLVVDGAADSQVTPSSCGADGICRAQLAKSVGDGEHNWKVIATDGFAHSVDSQTTRKFKVAVGPAATLTITPNPALVNRPVTFVGSSGLDAALSSARFEWDLDGDGRYELDTGTQASATKTYDTTATVPIGLRVTTGTGLASTATQQLKVTLAPAAGTQLGVSINNGAQFTKDPKVTVTAIFPGSTTSMLFSNDGGFFSARPFTPAKETQWTLASSGPERLPKTIYVRFLSGPLVSETYQDDIILDEVPPKVEQASVSAPASGAAAIARLRTWKLKVKATDTNSGVAGVQVTANKKKPGKLLRYKRKLTVKSAARPKFVRARDRAGNTSRWRKAR